MFGVRSSGALRVTAVVATIACGACAPSAPSATSSVSSTTTAGASGSGAGGTTGVPTNPLAPRPVASLHDLMSGLVDPAADALWNSVATVSSSSGTEDRRPRTEAEWMALRREALLLAEAANLLAIDGRAVVLPGEKIDGADAPGARTAAQIAASIAADRPRFAALARAMQQTVAPALAAIDRRDADALFESGGAIDEACEACHKVFWYPDAK